MTYFVVVPLSASTALLNKNASELHCIPQCTAHQVVSQKVLTILGGAMSTHGAAENAWLAFHTYVR